MNAQIEVASAANDLADQHSARPYRIIARLGNKVVKALVPNILETGPAPGEWRQSIASAHKMDRLFGDILVPINGLEDGWNALEQAFIFVKREGSSLHGLYILPAGIEAEDQLDQDVKSEFIRRCEAAGVPGELQVTSGNITTSICDRARWNDLVILNLSYPPETSWFERMSSGISSLVQKCPRPICFTPQTTRALTHPLLAYDGSLKAQEALFIATYLAGRWEIPLHVITIGDEDFVQDIQGDARKYLEEHDVEAGYIISASKDPVEVILEQADQIGADMILLGGYSRHPVIEVIKGSDVDNILRLSKIPLLICR
jgi:nucleotide-binding universal stress UspA family protein